MGLELHWAQHFAGVWIGIITGIGTGDHTCGGHCVLMLVHWLGFPLEMGLQLHWAQHCRQHLRHCLALEATHGRALGSNVAPLIGLFSKDGPAAALGLALWAALTTLLDF